ncbi:mucin-binding protein, partial [Enterobacter cloacae complex sp.6701430]|uniref:mucin-binding protein n=1 Tax=Enterobacter cloacae complex sp.6701430 TaxID=3397176 RepID=UPI003AAFED41
STAETIKNYENKGYELVSDDFPSDGVTFTEDEQHYVVHLKHKIDKDSLSKTVRETIHYVYEDGSKAAEDVFDSAHFAHEIIIDRVTGEIVKDNGWTNVDKDYFSQKDSPVIDGYTASKKLVNKIEGLTQDSKD